MSGSRRIALAAVVLAVAHLATARAQLVEEPLRIPMREAGSRGLEAFMVRDASRVLSIGVSAGGFANVALTADPPATLVAAISFAGGRGSRRPDEVCNPSELVRAFAEFGRTSRVPMLWVYADNDHFFGPQLAGEFHAAFTRGGGRASLVRAAAFRRDGHGLFSAAGIPLWTPMVDDFLDGQKLRLRSELLQLPVAPDIAPPGSLPATAQAEWRNFLTLPQHRAFALSGGGHYAYSFGRRSDKEAQQQAMEHCRDSAPRGDACELIAIPQLR